MKANFFHEDHQSDFGLFKKALVISLIFHAAVVLFFSFYKVAETRRVFLSPINMVELSDSPPSGKRSSSSRRVSSPPPAKPPPASAPKAVPRDVPKPAEKLPPIIPKKIEDSPPVKKTPDRPKTETKELTEEELREKLRRLEAKAKSGKTEKVKSSEEELRERLNRLKAEVADKEATARSERASEALLRERLKHLKESTTDREASIAAADRSSADVKKSIEKIRSRFATEEGGPSKGGVVASSGGTGGGSSTGSAVGDVRFAAYRERLWEHVRKFWNLPPFLAGKGLSTVIAANVTRSGNITKSWIETPSGNDAFDKSALGALMSAAPLPEIPPDIPDKAFADGLGFRFSEGER